MKDFLITNYKFNKGAIGAGYVEIFEDDFRIDRLISVINQTQGVVLYATGSPTLKLNSVSDKKVYFGVDTSTYNNTDILQIVYNSSNPLEVIAQYTDENVALLRQISRLLSPVYSNPQAASDGSMILKVGVNGWSSAIGAISVATTANSTINITNMLGISDGNTHYGYLSRSAFFSHYRNLITI